MNWLAIAWAAVKGLIKGIKLGKKIKAEGELDQGKDEVKTSESNSRRVAEELAEYPRESAPATPAIPVPSGPIRG